jgi:ssDNA-binding replication factor A large subunit
VIELVGGGDGGQGVPETVKAQRLVKVAEVAKHVGTGNVTLEVMALSKGSVREVSLKDGSTAKKGEVVLGDDTGEITTVAWDEAAKMVGEIQAGEKLRVHDAVIQMSKMGVETLELKASSKVERL